MTDNDKLDEILEYMAESYYPEHEYNNMWRESNKQLRDEAKQAILDWHSHELAQAVAEARIDELSYIWYDKKLGLILAKGTGINDRILQLAELAELTKKKGQSE